VKRPRPGPRPSPPPTILQIRYPHDGDTLYTTELRVAWQCTWPEAEDPSFARVLLKNGVELQRIGPINYAGRGLSDSLNLFGRISGTDYQVMIEAYDWDIDRGAPVYAASVTSGFFTFVNQIITPDERYPVTVHDPAPGTYPIGTALHLVWQHFPRRRPDLLVRILLVRDSTEGGGQWTVADSLPSSPGEATWAIPDDIPPGDGYRIRIEQIGGSGADVSKRPFTITGA
jgi:hypothetical protein